ncbi:MULTISPECIES: hypothetical protein [Thermomonosporaceae]|uniref:hypothetical protein n=1 Tax=Thermomonosporaceae TaxID=2012 RepID=UPI00255B18D5|nr:MULTISPECIES: hypothetical protein [Thermomonosporaceae]MDL4771057.1 hypothetical protein [Actinomadura xylanilytica]
MAAVSVGLIGPGDLVERVAAVCAETEGVRALPLPYGHEDETAGLVRSVHDDADALLFTGIVPWTIARGEGLLDRPAEYVSYTGATLLRGLVELLRLGHDVSGASIDTLPRDQVEETMREARLPTGRLRVLEHRPGLAHDDFVGFHRDAHAHGSTIAITCLRSAYEALEPTLPVLRLQPSRHSTLEALRTLVLRVSDARSSDAQVAIGLIEPGPGAGPGAAGQLRRRVAALGGSLARVDERTHMLIMTRGPLEELTAEFTRLPPDGLFGMGGAGARTGLGLGATAAEAEARARRALARARDVGATAVVATADHTDLVLSGPAPAAEDALGGRAGVSLALVARRVGVRKETLERLRGLRPAGGVADAENAADGASGTDAASGTGAVGGAGELTAKDVSAGLGIEEGSARRLLKRLERAGVAEPVGSVHTAGRSGRPPVVYRLKL